MKRRICRVAVIGALAAVPLVAACGSGAPTAGPQLAVTVGDLQQKDYFYQGRYLGRIVTVSARVGNVLGPRVFELFGGDFRDEKLVVVTDRPVEVSKDEAVRVTGTVGQLHHSAPSEEVPYLQQALYTRYETEPYLYHASVEPLPVV